jgi:hypothetical protein
MLLGKRIGNPRALFMACISVVPLLAIVLIFGNSEKHNIHTQKVE